VLDMEGPAQNKPTNEQTECFEEKPNPPLEGSKVGPPKGFRQPQVADATILARVPNKVSD